MRNKDFTISMLVESSPEEVFNDILKVKDWWFGEIEGNTTNLNDEFSYKVGDVHYSAQKVIELVPYSKIVWLVTDGNLSFVEDKQEWVGTKIIFDIEDRGDQTKLSFTHEGLSPELECYEACSGAWSRIIQESLKGLITIGKGVKIF